MLWRDLKDGTYVQYAPSMEQFVLSAGDGVKGEHTFYPKHVKKWRVFRKELGAVEMIPAESAGRLTLFGRAGWRNAVLHQQNVCKTFVDGQFALESFCLGMTFTDASISAESLQKHCKNGSLNQLTDYGYACDLKQMQNDVLPSKISWLASRYVKRVENGYLLILRVSVGKALGEAVMAEMTFDGVIRKEYERTFDVCPVLIMAHNVGTCDGDGTLELPYALKMG